MKPKHSSGESLQHRSRSYVELCRDVEQGTRSQREKDERADEGLKHENYKQTGGGELRVH